MVRPRPSARHLRQPRAFIVSSGTEQNTGPLTLSTMRYTYLTKPIAAHWLCCLTVVLALSQAAHAQYDRDWLYHVRAGALIGINIKANFSTSGQFNLAENLPVGTYDDGYVRTDQTGNARGLTSYWGYQNESQVDSANHTLLMHQSTVFSSTTSGSGNDSPYVGGELAGAGN